MFQIGHEIKTPERFQNRMFVTREVFFVTRTITSVMYHDRNARRSTRLINMYSNSVSNKVESRRDETLLRTELRTNSATVNNEEYFLRNFG